MHLKETDACMARICLLLRLQDAMTSLAAIFQKQSYQRIRVLSTGRILMVRESIVTTLKEHRKIVYDLPILNQLGVFTE